MSEVNINVIHTPCKKCVFAKYDANTQIDCHLGLISKFKEKDIEIIEAYDREKEFYIINNKKCYGYKEDKYFINRDINDLSIDEKVEYIQKTFKINYLSVINLSRFTLDELDEILSLLTNCSIPPKKIILIRYQTNKDTYAFDKLKPIIDKYNPKEWKIQTVLDNDEDYFTVLHRITNINKNNFILSIDGNYENMSQIIDYAQNKIYNEFNHFVVLSNNSKTTIFYNKSVYKASFVNGKDILTDYTEYEMI